MTAHVCHVSSVHQGLDIRIARKESLACAQAGFRTSLVITASEADVAEARGLGFEVLALPAHPPGSRLLRGLSKARLAMNTGLQTGAEILHVHDPELLPLALLARRRGRIVVMDVHEDLRNQIHVKPWIPPSVRPVLGHGARWVERFVAARVDAVVTVSPLIAAYFEDVAQRLVLVRNFASRDEFAPAPKDSNWSARDRVCYVGGISLARGILGMVRALPIAGVRMLLAGRFHSEKEKALVTAEPGWQQVDYLGNVDRPVISDIFAKAFAGLLTLHPTPNHVSTFAIKMFEYMAAGIPVITSAIPTWQEIVEAENCGIVAGHDDPGDIARAILALKNNPARARALGENGRRSVLSRYNWESESHNLIDLYRSLLSSRGFAASREGAAS